MTKNIDSTQLEWLYAHAGPILRWRLVTDFSYPASKSEASALKGAMLSTEEVQRWLTNLGSRSIHGSKDTDAENAMAKLVEYGLRAGIPDFDEKMLLYTSAANQFADCFLIAAGYCTNDSVATRFRERLDAVHQTTLRGDYDFYLSPTQAKAVPKSWQGLPIYRPEFGWDEGLPLPNCCDLYAMAHWTPGTEAERQKIHDVIAYVSHPLFQATPGGYFWSREKNRCYSAGRGCLACLNPERLVLFTELFARFKETHDCDWFKDALTRLEFCRTERGTWIFPTDYLKEKRNSYYLYQGAHMGLGENRRQRNWCELESTFRMLNIHRLMSQQSVAQRRGKPRA